METKFFMCSTCGNVVVKAIDSGVDMSCCGKYMMELTPKTTEEGNEKHLPVIECIDNHTFKVKIGAQPHPMDDAHHIVFIYVETNCGGHLKYVKKNGPAEVTFCLGDEKPKAVYAYCNVHGLWKTENPTHQNCSKNDGKNAKCSK